MKTNCQEIITIIRALENYRETAKHSANAAMKSDNLFYWKDEQVKAHQLLIKIREARKNE